MELLEVPAILGHKPGHRHGLKIKNNISESIMLKVLSLNAREYHCADTCLCRVGSRWLDAQLYLAGFAINLIAHNQVIIEGM